jgi:hypothetical protein
MSPKRARWTAARKSKRRNAVRRPGNIQLGMLVVDLAAPALTAVDFAKQVDRDWFRSHPQRSHRLRRAIPGRPALHHELMQRSRAYEVAPDPEDPSRDKPLRCH